MFQQYKHVAPASESSALDAAIDNRRAPRLKREINLPSLWEGGESCEPEGHRSVVFNMVLFWLSRLLAQPSLLVALASLPGGERITIKVHGVECHTSASIISERRGYERTMLSE